LNLYLNDDYYTLGTDKETALHMLEACSNNLENALSTYLDSSTGNSQNIFTSKIFL